MGTSWRDILDKAAASLPVEPARKPQSLRSTLEGVHASPWADPRPHGAESSRDPLARELERVAGRSSHSQRKAARAEGTVSGQQFAFVITPPASALQTPRTRLERAKSWRNIVAVLLSLAVIGFTAYAFVSRTQKPAELIERKSKPPGLKPLRHRATPNVQHALSAPPTVRPGAAAPEAKPLLAGLNPITEQALMDRAAEQFRRGEVGVARIIYETLASYGSSRAALSLAETYEAAILWLNSLSASAADPRKARLWYEKAALLGSVKAYKRLQAMEGG